MLVVQYLNPSQWLKYGPNFHHFSLKGNPKAEAIRFPGLAGAATKLRVGTIFFGSWMVSKRLDAVSVAMTSANVALGAGVLSILTGAMGVVVTVAKSC